MSDLITISIPTYRRPSLLLHAVHSCILQDYRPLEIDISDDSPSDESERLLCSLALPAGIALRYWRNSPALKQPANVNKLFTNARGSRLVLLHDDDILLPGAISALNEAFSMSPLVVASYGLQQVILDNGEVSSSDTDGHHRYSRCSSDMTGLQDDVVSSALWLQFPNNGYLIGSDHARSIGYRGDDEVGSACDADFGIRFALAHRSSHFAFINRYTSQYRLTSTAVRTTHNTCWKLFDKVLAMTDLTPDQLRARDELLQKISEEALVDNAIHERRRKALAIFCSPFYPKLRVRPKALYHLGLIAHPGMLVLRDRFYSRAR